MKWVAAVLLVAICLVGISFAQTTRGKTVEVNHEWGALKEVVVGRGDVLLFPSYHPSVGFSYAPDDRNLMDKFGGTPASEVEPENTKRLQKQIADLITLLQEHGVTVHRPAQLSDAQMQEYSEIQKGAMFLYARDPMIVIGNKMIESSLKVPMRYKERYGVRPILREMAEKNGAEFIAAPAPSPDFGEDEIYLEGGDVLLNGYEIYVGNSGRASNPQGIAWLQSVLGDKYNVNEVKMSHDFQHLDCIMSLVRPGLGLLCRDALEGPLPASLRDWEFIDVTIDEAKHLGCNIFVLDDKTVIVDPKHKRITEELRKRGVNVLDTPYDAVTHWDGGFRCSHHPLYRKSDL